MSHYTNKAIKSDQLIIKTMHKVQSGLKCHPNLLLSIKSPQPTLNLALTKYPILKQIATLLQMQIDSQHYSLLWTDHPLTLKQIRDEQPEIKINHFPEITQLTRKNKMAAHLNLMRLHFPKEYCFFPETYLLPYDHHRLTKKHQKGKVYIVKPENGCQGQGIYLTTSLTGLVQERNQVVQEYVGNPMLIDGLKFDLRIYVLITSVKPLRIYLYKEGMVRFATQKFTKPSQNNLTNTFAHLTNYAINKTHHTFNISQNHDQGHKRLLSSVFINQHYTALMEQIANIVNKTVISALPQLQSAMNQCKKTDPGSCFQLLGFDIMLTDKNEVLLLEVNQNPSLNTDTTFDHKLKSQLVRNVLEMVTGGYRCSSEDKFQTRVKLKDRHEAVTKKNFTRIYPCQNLEQTQLYDKFISKASVLYSDRFGLTVSKSQRRSRQAKDESRSGKTDESVSWNEQPSHYSQNKMEKIYGLNRSMKSSTFKKRLIFA